MLFTTVTTYNNFDLTKVLAASIKQHMPSAKVTVCLVEEQIPKQDRKFPYYDHIILAKELDFPNFDQHIFKHNTVEACTSVKARLFQYLLKRYPREDKFVFLDGDVQVFGPFDELERILDQHAIAVSPHILQPETDVDRIKSNELNLARFGMYNMGFLAVKRSQMGLDFLNWWQRRLDLFCYIEPEKQIFTDQRWIDFAPSFFDVHIIKHPGYNTAPWNLSFRWISMTPAGDYFVNGEALRFFHFSGVFRVKGRYTEYMRLQAGVNEAVLQLAENYQKLVLQYRRDLTEEVPWSYDYFKSGERIDHETRIAYRNQVNPLTRGHNPFDQSNLMIQTQNALEYGHKSTLVFGTIATLNYLPLAVGLAKSIKSCHPNSRVVVCMAGEIERNSYPSLPYVDKVVGGKSLDLPFTPADHTNLCTIMKPYFLSFLYKFYPNEEKFVLLDADIQLLSPLYELNDILEREAIVLTPHLLHPEHDKAWFEQTELAMGKCGMYNPGFVAIRRDASAQFFIQWWKNRTEMNHSNNWLDYAPSFFQVHILRHAGYNVAPWNIYHRGIQEKTPQVFSVNNQPLRFFHFSGALRHSAADYLKSLHRHSGEPLALRHIIEQYYDTNKRKGGPK